MPLVTRELQIIYGSVTIGAGTSYIIDGTDPISLEVNYSVASVSATVIVASSTEAGFNTACDALEDAFRTPRQRLRVILGATTMWDYNPTTNTGFNARPSISKPGSRHDTGRSRRYQVRVEVDLPADLTNQNGRATSSVNLTETDARRRRVIIGGTYTALSSNSARDQYTASIDAYASAVLGAFGGTWEGPFDITADADDADKILQFSRTYEELIYNQSSGVLNDTQIRRPQISVGRIYEAPGDSRIGTTSPVRLATIPVSFDCSIDKTNSTDLDSIYESKIKPYMIQIAETVSGGSSLALVNEVVNLDRVENRISADLTFLGAGSSGILSASVETEDTVDHGVVLTPVWSGDRHAKFRFQGPASLVRTIVTTVRELTGTPRNTSLSGDMGIFGINKPLTIDTGEDFSFFGIGGGGGSTADALSGPTEKKPPTASPDGGTLKGVEIFRSEKEIPLTLGRPGDRQFQVTDRVTIIKIAYYVEPPGGASGTGTAVRNN